MESRLVIAALVVGLALWGTALVPWVAAGRSRILLRAVVILAGTLALAGAAALSSLQALGPTAAVVGASSLAIFGGARFLRAIGCCPMATTMTLEVGWWLVLASPFLAAPIAATPAFGLDGQLVTKAIALVHPVGVLLDAGWGIDWFRADHLYDVSPLGSHFFRYPELGTYVGRLLLVGGVALGIGVGVERIRRGIEARRSSPPVRS